MTVEELSQLYYLRIETDLNRQQLRDLDKLRGDLPRICHPAIAACKKTVRRHQKRCISQLERLEKYIGSIEDDFVQQVFIQRYAGNMSWQKIGRLTGDLYSDEYLRKMCYRYLDRRNRDEQKERQTAKI